MADMIKYISSRGKEVLNSYKNINADGVVGKGFNLLTL